MTPALLHDTEAYKAMESNLDHTVPAKNRNDVSAIDSYKTREFPNVSFDKRLNKENLTEEIQSSTIQSIEIDESIRLSRENPEVLSDNESERMDENEDAICNSKHIQDASFSFQCWVLFRLTVFWHKASFLMKKYHIFQYHF